MDFFDITSKHINTLNSNDKEIYNYIIDHIAIVKKMTIRDLAAELFVSPATILRFLRKIGFSGYSEFLTILKYTDTTLLENEDPFVMPQQAYQTEYLKNIYESVRVMEKGKVDRILDLLKDNPRLIVMARGLNKSIGHYFEYIFSGLGFEVSFPEDQYFRQMLLKGIRNTDLVFFITYEGEDERLIHDMEELHIQSKAMIISITSADNNTVQNLSHMNLYVFADDIIYNGINMTSRISMIGLIEMIAYRYIEQQKHNQRNEKKI